MMKLEEYIHKGYASSLIIVGEGGLTPLVPTPLMGINYHAALG